MTCILLFRWGNKPKNEVWWSRASHPKRWEFYALFYFSMPFIFLLHDCDIILLQPDAFNFVKVLEILYMSWSLSFSPCLTSKCLLFLVNFLIHVSLYPVETTIYSWLESTLINRMFSWNSLVFMIRHMVILWQKDWWKFMVYVLFGTSCARGGLNWYVVLLVKIIWWKKRNIHVSYHSHKFYMPLHATWYFL